MTNADYLTSVDEGEHMAWVCGAKKRLDKSSLARHLIRIGKAPTVELVTFVEELQRLRSVFREETSEVNYLQFEFRR